VRVTHVIAFVLAAGAAGAEEATSGAAGAGTGPGASAGAAARTGPITVTYRSQTAVYLSAGRSAGLAVGDRLALLSGPDKAAELEVLFLADHSSSCRVVSEARPVKPGDKLVRLGPPRAAAPADGARELTVTEPADPPTVAYGSTGRARGSQQRWARIAGGASAGIGGFRDSSGSGRNVQEQQARADVTARDILGEPLEARVRVSGRHIEREGLRSQSLKAVDSRQRLYEASVAWAPVGGSFSAAAGRLGGGSFVGLGYLDGVVGQARPASGVQLGGFFGRTPDVQDVGVPTGAKYGAFVRFAKPGRSPGELLFSGEPLSAERAHQLAMVNRVVSPDELTSAGRALARSIAANAPLAVRAMKQAILAGRAQRLSEAPAEVRGAAAQARASEDAVEGLRAVAEKRRPVFRGR